MGSPLRSIVIADENDALRQGVRVFVERREPWRVVAEAADGHDALETIRATQPDIAILANELPSMNGLDLTRAIKRELPRTEVLIYTMLDSEALVTDLLRAGARGYVFKSDPQTELMAAIEALACGRPYFSSGISEVLLERILASPHSDGEGASTLTACEREVTQLVAEGKGNKEIALIRGNSIKTIETHRLAIRAKLKLTSTAALVRYAVRNHMIEA